MANKARDPNQLPFTQPIKGGKHWRFRRGDLQAMIPGQPFEAVFMVEYARLLSLSEGGNAPAPKVDPETFGWLVDKYLKSKEFAVRRPQTKKNYRKNMENLVKPQIGDQPFRLTTAKMIKDVRDGFVEVGEDEVVRGHRKGHAFVQMVSLLYTYAKGETLIPLEFINPTSFVKKLDVESKDIICWSDEEIDLVLAHCPPHVKTAILLALYTGQRCEDLATMDWSQFQPPMVRVWSTKTNSLVEVGCHSVLRAHLESIRTPFGGPIVRNGAGKPMTANALGKAITKAAQDTPGMPPHRSTHGLRYAAASRLEEAGLGAYDIAGIIGHQTYQMGMKYAGGRKRGLAGIAQLEAHDEAKKGAAA